MKKVLIIGSGGREHAIAWKVKKGAKVYVAPGNGGTAEIATNVPINVDDFATLVNFARSEGIDLTIVGPEKPISLGIYEAFSEVGLKILAPSKKGAKLEASKIFAKNFMKKYGILTADFRAFGRFEEAAAFIKSRDKFPVVIKADGLAAGKGVVIAKSPEEALETLKSFMIDGKFGEASKKVVIEDFLEGQEFSIFVLTDGRDFKVLGGACDYKRLLDGDRGPNTGGMGSVAPVPFLTHEKLKKVVEKIIEPTVTGIQAEGLDYRGFLYFGLIWTAEGPQVLEYNVRLGDPETQAIMPILEGDLLEAAELLLEGRLRDVEIKEPQKKAVTVIAASLGYPIKYVTGKRISGLNYDEDTPLPASPHALRAWGEAKGGGHVIFHAGTEKRDDGIYTAGGRVLAVTGVGESYENAMSRAYNRIEKIHFEGMYYRLDIGEKWTRKILIIAGSESDKEFVSSGTEILEKLGIPYEFKVISAHRNLRELVDFISNFRGFEVIIAVAGLSAHLPGVIAGLTSLPVIGVPRDVGPLNGMDALYSMVQMPRGVPVATMAIGKHGMINAVLYALRILANKYPWARKALENWRK